VTKLANDNHIVMVDDNPGDLFFVRQCLSASKLKNAWMSFNNGPEFLSYLERVKTGVDPMPALVLLDINMPYMTGLEILRTTRTDPAFGQLPVIVVLSSSNDPRDVARASELGATGFRTKASSLEEYVAFFNELSA
jgi:two-component system response regulator